MVLDLTLVGGWHRKKSEMYVHEKYDTLGIQSPSENGNGT